MTVIVDTSIWSIALRREAVALTKAETTVKRELADLIEEGNVVLFGIVRQEILSGIKRSDQFERLRQSLRAFPDVQLEIEFVWG